MSFKPSTTRTGQPNNKSYSYIKSLDTELMTLKVERMQLEGAMCRLMQSGSDGGGEYAKLHRHGDRQYECAKHCGGEDPRL